jgi:hypothetical protein
VVVVVGVDVSKLKEKIFVEVAATGDRKRAFLQL